MEGLSPEDDTAVSDEALDVEFAYTPLAGSCRDLHTIVHACRRPAGHEGDHAAGFGADRRRWAA